MTTCPLQVGRSENSQSVTTVTQQAAVSAAAAAVAWSATQGKLFLGEREQGLTNTRLSDK